MRLDRTTAILATIGAAALGYVAVTAYRRLSDRDPRAAALSEDEQDLARDINPTRAAGPEAMRDPPSGWSRADQASDESFPASDPSPFGSRVD